MFISCLTSQLASRHGNMDSICSIKIHVNIYDFSDNYERGMGRGLGLVYNKLVTMQWRILGFPRGGRQLPRWRRQPIDLAKFLQKLHENERIWTRGGASLACHPVYQRASYNEQFHLHHFTRCKWEPVGLYFGLIKTEYSWRKFLKKFSCMKHQPSGNERICL